MIKVGMDISQIAHQGGVATYTQNLALKLADFEDIAPTFFYSSLRKPYRGNLPNVKAFPIPPTLLEPMLNKLKVPIDLFLGNLDIFHSSDWIQPKTRAKKVTTYHDVIPLKFPQWSDPKIVKVHKRRLKIVEEEIDCVIAVSENTKKDLLEISKIPEEKIVVIYEGVEKFFRPQEKEEMQQFKKKYNLPDGFVLAVGGVGERKNLARIKEAGRDYNLIVLGEDIRGLKREELPFLYCLAKVLLYTSLYEGFGLPILEAMACGTPVVTSDRGSMFEIAGAGALFANPEDVASIKLRLRQAYEDPESRKILISQGLKRAKQFSWEKCAKETVEVYKRVKN